MNNKHITYMRSSIDGLANTFRIEQRNGPKLLEIQV